jgi:hypothetical protein
MGSCAGWGAKQLRPAPSERGETLLRFASYDPCSGQWQPLQACTLTEEDQCLCAALRSQQLAYEAIFPNDFAEVLNELFGARAVPSGGRRSASQLVHVLKIRFFKNLCCYSVLKLGSSCCYLERRLDPTFFSPCIQGVQGVLVHTL